jgi:Divergent InlB B-repeat domain
MTIENSMQKESMDHGARSDERAAPVLRRALRGASRGSLYGTMLVVLVMVLGSTMAAAMSSGSPHALPPNLHLAPPISTHPLRVVSPTTAPASSVRATPKMPAHLPDSSPSSARAASPHPATGPGYEENGSATFFSNVPIPNPAAGNNTCLSNGGYYYGTSYECWNITTEPTLNLTTHGFTGLAYTAFTNQAPCAGMVNYSSSEVGFVVSSNFGTTWSAPAYLGNPICTGDPDQNYSSAFEPSLTSLADGTFVLTYAEYNSSAAYSYDGAPPEALSCGYTTGSRIVVTESTNNGATWSTPIVINGTEWNSSVNSCPTAGFPDVRPQITAIGDTIYLTWSNVTDPLESYSYCYYCYGYGNSEYSAGVHFIDSTDGGGVWSAEQNLTVLTNSMGGTTTSYATNPSIMVDPSGQLYIAYSTNYTYASYCGIEYCDTYVAASILVATSTNNGTSFNYTQADQTVFANYPDWYPYVYWEPFTTMGYSAVNHQAYLAYQGAAVGTFCYNDGPYGDYCYQQEVDKVWFQNSSNAGLNWSVPTNPSAFNHTEAWFSPAYNPSFAVTSDGQIDLQYVEINEAVCENLTATAYFTPYYCGAMQGLFVTSNDNGSTWSNPVLVSGAYSFVDGPYRDIWDGFTSSTLAAGGQVLLGWTAIQCFSLSTTGCYQPYYAGATPALPPTSAEVWTSRLYEGVGLTITFNETGLPKGTVWSVDIQGNVRNGPEGVNLSISGVPPASLIGYTSSNVYPAYGEEYTPTFSVVSPSGFTKNTTVVTTFSEDVLVNVLTVPNGFENNFWTYPDYGNVQMSPAPGSVWEPTGTSSTFTVSYIGIYAYCYDCLNLTFESWSGTGPGSVTTNSTSVTFTPSGPINETASFQMNGYCFGSVYVIAYALSAACYNYTYSLTFLESGLPAGTNWGVSLIHSNASTVYQTGNSTALNFPVGAGLIGFQAWTIPSDTPGEYWIPSSTTTSPLSLPQPTDVTITYALGGLSASSFATTFQETGLPNGTAWGLEVGGQALGMTTSNGTVSLAGASAPAVNGSAVYLESGDGYYVSSVTVTPWTMNDSSYTVAPDASIWVNGSALVVLQYSPMYLLTVTASNGGTVSPANEWIEPGQSVTIGETASSNFHFVDWTGTGSGSTSTGVGNPTIQPKGVVTEFATFKPNSPPTWNVTLQPLGLPSGAAFAVSIGGTTYSGVGAFKVGNLTQGDYLVSFPTSYLNSSETTRYVPTDVASTTLSISSGVLDLIANGTISITFTGQYAVSIASTPGGTVSWGTGSSSGIYWLNASASVSFLAMPDPHYYFVGWNGTGNGSVTSTSSTISLVVLGPATETAQFQYRPTQPPATYWLTVTQSGLPAGITWSVAVGGLGASGSATTLTVVGLNGTYGLTAPTIYTAAGIRWISNTVNVSTAVTANGSYAVSYSEQFEVTVLGAVGGSVTPIGTEWVAPGTVVNLAASANSSSVFLSWNGTGAGNYTGSAASTSVTVNAPITEQVNFGPKAVPKTTSGTSASSGQLYAVGLLAVLLVAGLVVGLLLGRRRSPPPMAEVPTETPEPGPDGTSDEMVAPVPEYDEGPPIE